MTRLSVVPTPAQRRARFTRDTAGLELPAILDDSPITWQEWEPRPWTTHIDTSCEQCKSDNGVITHGLVTYRERRVGLPRPPWQVIRYLAYGCLDCRFVEVIDVYPEGLHSEVFEPERAWVSAGQQQLF